MERALVMLTVQSTYAECSVGLARFIISSLRLNNNSLTEYHSQHAGDGRSNQHGRPIGQPSARGDQ
jgi:hypothetical protein